MLKQQAISWGEYFFGPKVNELHTVPSPQCWYARTRTTALMGRNLLAASVSVRRNSARVEQAPAQPVAPPPKDTTVLPSDVIYNWPNAWAPSFQTDFKSGEIGRERTHLARDAYDAKTSSLFLSTSMRSSFSVGCGPSAFDRKGPFS
eukprot:1631587-Pleurochrysis_carterae.AAC.4